MGDTKRVELPVLVMSKHVKIARDFATELSNRYEFGDAEVCVTAIGRSVKVGQSSEDTMTNYFTIICFYAAEQGDVPILLPMIDAYSMYPVKIIVHETSVTFSAGQAANVTKVPRGDMKVLAQNIKVEREKFLAQLLIVFKSLDKDNSGYIDADELVKASKELGTELTKEQADSTLVKIDTDGDKKISFDEFAYWWSSGRKLFGHGLKDMLISKLKDSAFVKTIQSSAKGEDTTRSTSYFHFGVNKEDKARLQLIIKAASYGPEYNEIKKAYFPQYTPNGIHFTVIMNCRTPATALSQVEKVVTLLAMIHGMMVPQSVVSSEELKPVVKQRGSSIVVSLSLGYNEDSSRQQLLESMAMLAPILKIGGQSVELKLRFASDLNVLCTDKRPIYSLIMEGCGMEIKTSVLQRNIDLLLLMVPSLFPKREMLPKIVAQLLFFSQIDTKAAVNPKIQEAIVETIAKEMPELKMSFCELKEKSKAELKETVDGLPPFVRPIYDFVKNQLESIQLVGITDDLAVDIFAVAPGLDKFLSVE